jgi:hypothetical protein
MLPGSAKYRSQVVSLGEFETLTGLVNCLLPRKSKELAESFASLFDFALHQSKRGPWKLAELPPDSQAIRYGLQLLNDDALRYQSRPFALLPLSDQEALLSKIQTDGNLHWANFPAGKWYAEVLCILTDLYMASDNAFDSEAEPFREKTQTVTESASI